MLVVDMLLVGERDAYRVMRLRSEELGSLDEGYARVGLKERDEFGKDRWFYFLVSVDHQEIRRVAVEESEGVVDCPCLEALPVAAVNVAKAVFTADLLHRHALAHFYVLAE